MELLPNLIDRVPSDTHLCVFPSFTLSLADGKPREKLEQILARASEKRRLFHIGLEWPRNSETPLLSLSSLGSGENGEKVLAKCNAHGEWLEWLSDSANAAAEFRESSTGVMQN